jgi:hypothetical protein
MKMRVQRAQKVKSRRDIQIPGGDNNPTYLRSDRKKLLSSASGVRTSPRSQAAGAWNRSQPSSGNEAMIT